MNEDAQAQIKEMARDHAIRTIFMMTCAACGYNRATTQEFLAEFVEKIRREPFPTNDPAQSMLAADEIADAFFDLLRPDEQSLALLDRLSAARRR